MRLRSSSSWAYRLTLAGAAAVTVAAPSAAWAGPHRNHAPKVRSGSTSTPIIYQSTGNPNYGWVIPITFVYAPGYGPG